MPLRSPSVRVTRAGLCPLTLEACTGAFISHLYECAQLVAPAYSSSGVKRREAQQQVLRVGWQRSPLTIESVRFGSEGDCGLPPNP